MQTIGVVKNSIYKKTRGLMYSIFFLGAFFVTSTSVFAAVSSTTNCNAVTWCASDTSIKGADAGNIVCGNQGMDYAPACNSAKCVDASGKGSYACIAKVQTNTGTSTSTTTDTGGTSSGSSTTSTSGSDGSGGSGGCEAGFEKISGVCFPTDTQLPDPQGGFMQILDNLLRWLLAIFAILAIGAFVISGIQYLISAGDDDMIETAKRNMKWSAVGVLVGLSGWVILQAISGALSGSVGF